MAATKSLHAWRWCITFQWCSSLEPIRIYFRRPKPPHVLNQTLNREYPRINVFQNRVTLVSLRQKWEANHWLSLDLVREWCRVVRLKQHYLPQRLNISIFSELIGWGKAHFSNWSQSLFVLIIKGPFVYLNTASFANIR